MKKQMCKGGRGHETFRTQGDLALQYGQGVSIGTPIGPRHDHTHSCERSTLPAGRYTWERARAATDLCQRAIVSRV